MEQDGSATVAPDDLPRSRRVIPILVLLAVLGSSLWLKGGGPFNHSAVGVRIPAPISAPADNGSVVLHASNTPTPGYEAAKHPLGAPAKLAATSNSYRFISYQTDKKTPAAYDPCRPLHYVIRTANQPSGGKKIILSAISEVSHATGLQFIFDGTTTETPSFQRPAFQPDRYGDRWAPVLIAWATAAENPNFLKNVDGEGGSVLVTQGDGPKIYVTGTVELDSMKLAGTLSLPGGTENVRSVVLHELGHLVGLAHVTDINQLMYPESGHGITDFHSGDLTGLSMLGKGACAPNL